MDNITINQTDKTNNNPKKTPNNNPINAIINLTPIVLVLNNHFLKFALFL